MKPTSTKLATQDIALPRDLELLTEDLAEHIHDVWMKQRLAEGWSLGSQRDDVLKLHPGLVPYDQLTETEKQYDRNSAVESLKGILALGWQLAPVYKSPALEGPVAKSEILQKLAFQEATRAELHQWWRDRPALELGAKEEFYKQFTQAANGAGEFLLAEEAAREGLIVAPRDFTLEYQCALALAQLGAPDNAKKLALGQLHRRKLPDHQREEMMALLGRLEKDRAVRETNPRERRKIYASALRHYAKACATSRRDGRTVNEFAAINAATTALLAGEIEKAHYFANLAAEACRVWIGANTSAHDYWKSATLAEAQAVLGDLAAAKDEYYRAAHRPGVPARAISSTRRQAALIAEAQGWGVDTFQGSFPVGRVLVFSGHMLDNESRATPRFPARLEPAVAAAMREALAELKPEIGFSAAASGGDILFLEILLELGAAVHIVLPYAIHPFAAHSVFSAGGEGWLKRFWDLSRRAATVREVSQHHPPESAAVYEYSNRVANGLALLQADALGWDVLPVVLWDGQPGPVGGTAAFVQFWNARGVTPRHIELPAVTASPEDAAMKSGPPAESRESAGSTDTRDVADFTIKAMLFADAVGYSTFDEQQVRLFIRQFLPKVSELMARSPNHPVYNNTWGDAFYFVFNSTREAGCFAFELQRLVGEFNQMDSGLPKEMAFRIGLHAGPVLAEFDPIVRQATFCGTHVSKAARIEPAAQSGAIYVSEEFAALARTEDVREFRCEYLGTQPLAKAYGSSRLYRLEPTAQV